MKKLTAILLAMVLLLASTAYAESLTDELGLTTEAKPATACTAEVNSAVYSMLDFADTSEYDNAVRGLIDAPEVLELTDAEGNVIWSQAAYAFLEDYEEAPATVNPSLWENTKNNHAYKAWLFFEHILFFNITATHRNSFCTAIGTGIKNKVVTAVFYLVNICRHKLLHNINLIAMFN